MGQRQCVAQMITAKMGVALDNADFGHVCWLPSMRNALFCVQQKIALVFDVHQVDLACLGLTRLHETFHRHPRLYQS